MDLNRLKKTRRESKRVKESQRDSKRLKESQRESTDFIYLYYGLIATFYGLKSSFITNKIVSNPQGMTRKKSFSIELLKLYILL